MTAPLPAAAVTVDAFLGGRVEAVQPKAGHHRSGLEAVLLAAAVEPGFSGTLVDLGAGVGVAGLCIAARCPSARVLLVERDGEAIACARAALARPANRAFADRVTIAATDIGAPEAARIAAGLGRAFADIVVTNPPFYERHRGTVSPQEARADAHVLAADGLEPWLRAAAAALKPGGHVVVIFRADRLDALLAALAGRFGGALVLPVHPRAHEPAHRVLIAAVKGSRARASLLPGLAVHPARGNTYLPPVENVLRHGAGLAEVHPAWRQSGNR